MWAQCGGVAGRLTYTEVPVDEEGLVTAEAMAAAMTDETVLVTVSAPGLGLVWVRFGVRAATEPLISDRDRLRADRFLSSPTEV
jgi:hypothetical protein